MNNDPNYKESSIEKTEIESLLVIHKSIFEDERGYFREALKLSTLETELGKSFHVTTWNHAVTNPKVLRGIHSESCAKLVYPTHGKCFIAFVDMRPDSKTFGKYKSFNFEDKNDLTIYKAEGIGIGVLATGDTPFEFLYLMDKEYTDLKQQGLMWNDNDVNIDWPVKKPIVSARDKNNPTLRELFPEKFR